MKAPTLVQRRGGSLRWVRMNGAARHPLAELKVKGLRDQSVAWPNYVVRRRSFTALGPLGHMRREGFRILGSCVGKN